MTRRDAAWLIMRAAAAAGAQDFFGRWLNAAPQVETGHGGVHVHAPPEADRWTAYRPAFFSAEQFKALAAFTSTLIPSDDTPGAREAHVPEFIDFVVNAAAEYAPEVQAEWRSAMAWISAHKFAELRPEEQARLVSEMSEPEREPTRKNEGYKTYRLLKDMTVHAFYTSRVGLIDVLEYKGLGYYTEFPPCDHPEHLKI